MAIDRRQRKEWAREHFKGLENIVLPSFMPDLSELDDEAVRLDVRQSVKHGVFSAFCSIEAGLTVPEKQRFVDVAVEAAGGDVCVGFPLCGDSLQENLELLEHAERAGASHALMSYPQTFVPQSEDDVYRYTAELCDATDLGIVLFLNDKYGFQRLHPSGVPFSAFDRLVEHDNVVALKASSMDLGMVHECFERYGDRILVSVPTIIQFPLVATHYDMQWSGAWTIEALQTPEQPYAVELFEHFRAGRADAAMELFWRISPLMGALGVRLREMFPTGMYHWTLFKYFQWLSGGNGGVTREPCMRLTARDMADVRGAFAAARIDVRDDDDADFFLGRSAARMGAAR